MEYTLPALRREERLALSLRALYEESGYALFRMGSFEEYDFYMQNRAFLTGDDIITFTAADGRLMALKPDVTLSIVKSTSAGQTRRVYYNESVFRRSRQTGEYREISQMGLEYIGAQGQAAESEVLVLAAKTLAAAGTAVLDLSHMEIVQAVLQPFGDAGCRAQALGALRGKSPHEMRAAAEKAGLSAAQAQVAVGLVEISEQADVALQRAGALLRGVPGAQKPLDELRALCAAVAAAVPEVALRLDFSILNDADYYNGLIYQGFVQGTPAQVLVGGRYDGLLERFNKGQGAVGFALSLDALGSGQRAQAKNGGSQAGPGAGEWLNVALPKGRLGNEVYRRFERAGFGCEGVLSDSRKLVFEDENSRVRYFLVKPSDVDIYVEHGAADIGVVGRDVLLESGADVLQLLDLGLGKCRLAVAGRAAYEEDLARPLRVATKYPKVARAYYAARSRAVEIIELHGSIELAPLLGLADVIVDIVETGSTLKENNLAVLAEVEPSSARLIANRASWRFKQGVISGLVERLGEEL